MPTDEATASALLVSSWAETDGRRRRVYGMTDQGAAALAAEQTEWRRFASGMHAVLGWPAQAARARGAGGGLARYVRAR